MIKRSKPMPLTTAEKEQIKVFIASGKSYHATGKELKRCPKTIKSFVIKPEPQMAVAKIKEELSGMFENTAKRMIASITNEDINKINAYQRVISAAAATDKMRMLKNQSTNNIDLISQTVKDLEEFKKHALNLADKLRAVPQDERQD